MVIDDNFASEFSPYDTLLRRAVNRTSPLPKHAAGIRRLHWTHQGPLSTAISVMDSNRNPNAPTEPCCQELTPSAAVWHSVSQEPLTTPKVSSISVVVDALEEYPDNWMDGHQPHADLDSDNCEFGRLNKSELGEDRDGVSEDQGRLELLRCCGTDRPGEISPLLVVASAQAFVTVHDYVSAVHPWLLDLRDRILWALNDVAEDKPLPAETKLCVNTDGLDSLMIEEEEDWKMDLSRPPPGFLAHHVYVA